MINVLKTIFIPLINGAHKWLNHETYKRTNFQRTILKILHEFCTFMSKHTFTWDELYYYY